MGFGHARQHSWKELAGLRPMSSLTEMESRDFGVLGASSGFDLRLRTALIARFDLLWTCPLALPTSSSIGP